MLRLKSAGHTGVYLPLSGQAGVLSTCPESSIVVVRATSSTWLWNTSKGRRSGCWWTVWEPPPIMRLNCILPYAMPWASSTPVLQWRGETSAPVIHRDLKPSNIIVTGANCTLDEGLTFSSLVIIDLGIARVWRDGADADTVKFGTRPYAPPEQYGFGQTSVRSDVYALGALLFFCLTGVDPKPGLDIREQCEARGIPTPLADAVCMSMALDPAKRFASAEALGRATRSAYDLSRPVRPPTPAPVRTPASETVLMLQGLQNPAGLPRPAASAACGLLSRVPESLGRIWNTLVCFSLLVFFAGSHFAVFHPTGANQSYPTWFLIIEYFFFVDGLMVLMHFVLLDKRRLRRRFALLDSYRGKKLAKLWLKALGVLLLCMIVIVAIANATGVVDTSAT